MLTGYGKMGDIAGLNRLQAHCNGKCQMRSESMCVLRQFIVVLSLLLSLSASTFAAELFVDQKHPKADDKNPGTEAMPFQTIQAAVNKAQAGDTIWVKAGNYEEPVKIGKSATATQPIVLSAWKDDRVRIGYRPRPLPAQGDWQPMPGSKSWQIKLTADMPQDFLLLLNGKAILTWIQDTPPKDEKVNWASYRRSDRTLMFNANGKNPGQLGKFQYGRRLSCLTFLHRGPGNLVDRAEDRVQSGGRGHLSLRRQLPG